VSAERAESFFFMLLRSIQAVHRDAGHQVASSLSSKLLLHIVVGRLAANLQIAMLSVLRGAVDALLDAICANPEEQNRDAHFLEALIPWISRRCMSDECISEFAGWAAGKGESVGMEISEHAGLPRLLEACCSVANRCAVNDRGTFHTKATQSNILSPAKRNKVATAQTS